MIRKELGMWGLSIKFLKLVGLSIEGAFCLGSIVRFFLDKGKINLERITLYGSVTLIATLFIRFSGLDAETVEIFTYGVWAFGLVLFLYTGTIFYKAWAIWVSCMVMYMAIGIMDLIVRVIFMQILGFSVAEMVVVDEFFWIPEIIAVIIMAFIFKMTPFYYKDKKCYKQMSVIKKIMIAVIVSGIGAITQASILALDGSISGIARGSLKIFIGIYAGLIMSVLCIFESYKELHKTYTNREELLISNFSKKHVNAAQQLDRQDKSNQQAREALHNQISDLAKVASEAGLEEIRQYAEKLADAVEPMNQEFLLTGHSVLDAVLKEKYIVAKEKGIKLANKISIPNHVALSSTDLSIIVGQALDYAIRRCEEVEKEKSIKVEGVWYKGYIILKVWYSTVDEKIEEQIKDKKQEIQIIQKYIRKYGGQFKEIMEVNRGKIELSFNATW